jgi:hypothetical protein
VCAGNQTKEYATVASSLAQEEKSEINVVEIDKAEVQAEKSCCQVSL